MLYKNDEVYTLSLSDIKEIKAKYSKFPLKLTYPESRIKQSTSKHNLRPDKPNSISFPLVATIKTKTGTERWRYAESSMVAPDGRTIWNPNNLILRGSIALKETDIELIYWLINCCPFLEGGKNSDGKSPKCVIEDLVGSAHRKVVKEQELVEFKAMLFMPKIGLSEKQIRQIAKAYFISEVDEMTLPQVKLAVEKYVMSDKISGIKNFIDLANSDQQLILKSTIQSAIDKKIIYFVPKTRQWAWVTERGTKNVPFYDVSGASDPNEALFEFYLADKKFARDLMSAINGGVAVLTDGGDDPDNNVE